MTDELDALVRPLVWTEESPNCWFGCGSFGYQRDFRVFDGVAKVRIGTIWARVTPELARELYDKEYVEFVLEALDRDAITTLRARTKALEEQVADLLADVPCACGYDNPDDVCMKHLPLVRRLKSELAAETARADRAEAERAAQIEADAGIAASFRNGRGLGIGKPCVPDQISLEIRAQPHDRTALNAEIRAAKVEAWKEAADLCQSDGWGYKDDILALIGEGV